MTDGGGQGPGDPAGDGASAARAAGKARGARLASGTVRGSRAAARGSARAARGSARAARVTAKRVRAATHAQGAGETGLGRLIELHGVNYASDALLAVALAGTLFFSVPVGQAREQVALYLLLTMAPFALLAPVIGPLLDKLTAGRRWALAATFVLRAALALVMAGAVAGGADDADALRLYPAAFGCLVLSRAYGVMRAAVVPRLLPPGIGLVSANGRAQLAGVSAAILAAGIGAGVGSLVGPAWVLRLCAALLAGGAVLSVRLPHSVDSAEGEVQARISTGSSDSELDEEPGRDVGGPVVRAIRANVALRVYSGFLTLFLAFLLREDPIGPGPAGLSIGIVVAGAALGSTAGTSAGTLLKERSPRLTVLLVLGLALTGALVGAWLWGGLITLSLVAVSAGFAQTLGKLSLDAVIQLEVPEAVRTSAFARSETWLQLGWVAGGGLGILLPLTAPQGLLLATAGLTAALVLTVRGTNADRQ